jgi:Homeodomain-like domain
MKWQKLRQSPIRPNITRTGSSTMPGKAAKIIVTERQLATLKSMIASSTCPQGVAQRARMIVLAFDGESNEAIAAQVGCERHIVGIWRRRWAKAFDRLVLVECSEKPAVFPRTLKRFLSDSPRRGWAGKFSAEQATQIIAIACVPPVTSISARQVGRFLKDGGPQAAPQSLLAQRTAQGPGGVSASSRGGMPMLS